MSLKVVRTALVASLAVVATMPKADAASAPEINAGVHITLDNF